QRLWKERPGQSSLTGITIFKSSAVTAEEILLNELGTIDLHHGEHSASPPYSVLEVIGCGVSEDIRQALEQVGFSVESVSEESFTAVRKDGNLYFASPSTAK